MRVSVRVCFLFSIRSVRPTRTDVQEAAGKKEGKIKQQKTTTTAAAAAEANVNRRLIKHLPREEELRPLEGEETSGGGGGGETAAS